jgi:hypothetical protein
VYGLMVGFSAYLVAFQFDAAQQTVENEANSVEEIYRLAKQLPGQERREVQGLDESYARTVVQEGWPLMEQGRSSSRAEEISDELRRSVMSFKPETEAEQAIYAHALMLVQDFDEYRSLRLLEVREGIPSILWIVLNFGGATTVGFTYLFRDEDAPSPLAYGRCVHFSPRPRALHHPRSRVSFRRNRAGGTGCVRGVP